MRTISLVLAGLLCLSAGALAQDAASGPPAIYRIDLVPTGSTFALGEPKLEGDVYVFRSLPEKVMERLQKSRVKAITRRTADFSKELVWQVDLNPTGGVLVKDEPKKKGTSYTLNTWRKGELLIVKEADVKAITKLTGMDAFKAEQMELGVALVATPPEGAGAGARASAPAPGSPAPAQPGASTGNWTYQGKPGVTDAYAPGNAVVERPGDVPKAPERKP